jgi:hypothetical protein
VVGVAVREERYVTTVRTSRMLPAPGYPAHLAVGDEAELETHRWLLSPPYITPPGGLSKRSWREISEKESRTPDLLSEEAGVMYVAAFERRAEMAIENRNLLAGTRLVAYYKKQRYVCTIEAAEEGEGVVYVLEDGSRHKSPSAAGMKVMGGKAVNGWRFWSLEGDAPEPKAEPTEKPAKARKGRKLIYRAPNQQGIAQDKSRWFCTACMKSFVQDGKDEPQVCPEGHRIDDPELTGAVGAAES